MMEQAQTNPSRLTQWLFPSIKDILFLGYLLGPFLVRESGVLKDGDTGWHIRNGECILRNWTWPHSDQFSYTHAGKAWFAWEWLSDVFMAIVHKYLGLNGIALWANFTFALAFTLLFWWMVRERGNLLVTLAFSGLAGYAATVHWLARPHLFTLLLFLCWFMLLDYLQGQSKFDKSYVRWPEWLLPLLMLLWVNLHGGFVVGLILLVIYALGNFLTSLTTSDCETATKSRFMAKYFARITVICLLVTTANPYGLRVHMHIFDSYLQSQELVDRITEFASPNFHMGVVKFFEVLLVVGIVILGASHRRLSFIESGLILFWTHMALFSVRHIPLYSLMIAPILTRHLSAYLNSLEDDAKLTTRVSRSLAALNSYSRNLLTIENRFKGLAYPALTTLVLIGLCFNQGNLLGTNLLNASFDPKAFPIGASHFIDQSLPPGNLFTTDYWGGYMIYRFYPRVKVFIDGRSDMYSRDLLREYESLVNLEYSWKEVLSRHQIRWILLPANYGLSTALKQLPEWQVVYDDHQAIIFVKGKSKWKTG